MSKKIAYGLIAALIVLQLVLLFFWLHPLASIKPTIILPPKPAVDKAAAVHYAYFSDRVFYDDAYQQARGEKVTASAAVVGGIIPHHLIVKDKIAAFFVGLEKAKYKTIILIGPNHYNSGPENIIVSAAVWQTPYGDLAPDQAGIKKIKSLKIFEEPFIVEHSISGLVSFIKKSLPTAKIIPIIIKDGTPAADLDNLAQDISDNFDARQTLVLASVDFSHYQPLAVANFHDQKSIASIENFDFNELSKLDTCSGPSLDVLLKYLEIKKAEKSDLLFSTNSGALLNNPDLPTTSHNIFYFYEGDKNKNQVVSMLFFGDIMLDRNVKTIIDKNGFDYLLENLAGEEKRFFRGLDIISGNLEGAVTDSGVHYSPEISNDFAFSPADVARLKKYNFNFFNIANNHILDQNAQGLAETKNNLTNLGFDYSGCPDAVVGSCSYKILIVNGYKIAMAGLSMVYHQFDLSAAKKMINELSKNNDAVIVNIHWGQEYQSKHNDNQEKTAHELIDSGADVIIGSHPHVIQDVEIYRGQPIFYSLGNFIFDQTFSAETQQGLAVGLILTRLAEGGLTWKISYFPFESIKNQVSLMNENKKIELLKTILPSHADLF